MANFSALKTSIQNYIKQNGNNEITGAILQQILLSMVTALGDNAINDLVAALGDEVSARQNADGTLQDNINSETTARSRADGTLQQNINSEASTRVQADNVLSGLITAEEEARIGADNTLRNSINSIIADIEHGYVYAGIATPTTTPATGKVFYLALTAGTYTNFGNTEVSQGINILKYDGSDWSLDVVMALDNAPTPSSNNLVKSGGVFDKVMTDGSAFDISAYFASGGTLAIYPDLSAALTALNTLSASYKKGGMSIKFVQSSDNKYVQYRLLLSDTWSEEPSCWLSVEEYLLRIEKSKNLYDYTKNIPNMNPIYGPEEGYISSDWIKVTEGETYVLSNKQDTDTGSPRTYRFATKAGDTITGSIASSIGGNSYYSIQIPAGVEYIRFGVYNKSYQNKINTCMFEKGSIPSSEYIPYGMNVSLGEPFDSIEENVENLKNGKHLEVIPSRNILDLSTTVVGQLDANGDVDSTKTALKTTDYIPIKPGECLRCISYGFEGENWNKICAYDSNHNLINNFSEGVEDVILLRDSNLAYIRFSFSYYLENSIMLFKNDVTNLPSSYISHQATIQYVDDNADNNTKVLVCDGDSIIHGVKPVTGSTAGMIQQISYINEVAHDLKSELYNFSISGSTLAYFSDGTNPQNALVDRYNVYPEANCIVIAIGSNDFAYNNVVLGQYGDNIKTTFYGALKLLCEGLKEEYPHTMVVFITPIKRKIDNANFDPVKGYENLEGKYLIDYVNAIKEVCGFYSYPVLDMSTKSCVNAWLEDDVTEMIPDGIHPNLLGHKLMKKPALNFINGYV